MKLPLRPRIKKVGDFWICSHENFPYIKGVGKFPEEAYNWWFFFMRQEIKVLKERRSCFPSVFKYDPTIPQPKQEI